jgi:hypothetical protein
MQGTVALILAATVFSQYNPAAAKLNDNHEAFKRKMMPYVGKTVTVTGHLSVGKISDFVWTDDPGAVYVLATKSDDIKKQDELSRQMGKGRIAVTGKLQFAEKVVPKNPDGSVRTDVSIIKEHFYIDIADATIRPVGRER